ncbi:MAG: hypothetical protein HUK24_04610 [Sphaerochaetaceae bacterium]|nr:hypothetical protein [Sphaerochaetaceae bacterium]
MKKVLLVLTFLLVSVFSLFAVKLAMFNNGMGIGYYGQSNDSWEAVIDLKLIPFDFDYLNPSINTEFAFDFRGNPKSVSLGLGIELFRTMNNPLGIFISNPSPWAPEISFSYIYGDEQSLRIKFSLLRTLDRDFIYQWLTPFIQFSEKGTVLWGIEFIHMTPLFSRWRPEGPRL